MTKTPNVTEPAIINYLADVSYGVLSFSIGHFYIIFTQLNVKWFSGICNGYLFIDIFNAVLLCVGAVSCWQACQIAWLKFWIYILIKNGFMVEEFLFGLVTIVTIIISPAVGDFETSLLVNSLQQAQTNLNRTHTVTAGDATALSDVTVIGDSVALRSSASFSSLLPDAQVDAAVSRSFDDAFEIFQNEISSGTLSQTTVLAVGVNSLDNYQEDLQQFIDALPDGYRLIIVTPYNANNEAQVKEVRDYELTLADTYNYVTVADWYKAATKTPRNLEWY